MTYTREQLKQIDEMPIKNVYGKIVVLDFKEKPLEEIQGLVTQGSMSCNGSAAIRRTINLTLAASPEYTAITNVDNLISINKKVKVFMGVQGTGEIFWFPLGLYVLSTANIQHQPTALTISITGKDKMCRLDGSAGGTLPASVVFNEKIEYKNGVRIVQQVPIPQMIRQALIQYGEEQDSKIIIADLDVQAKALARYNHNTPLYLNKNDKSFTFTNEKLEQDKYIKIVYGEDAGYFETNLTYPGQLVLNAGETVVTLLDKIVKALGNYEFFYDLDGNFIFQEKKNYLNNQFSHLKDNYISKFSENKYAYIMDNTKTISSISSNPKYDNIKNEFIVWGQRTSTSGANVPILFHLVIDEKPKINLAKTQFWGLKNTTSLDNDDIRWAKYLFQNGDPEEDGEWEKLGEPCEEWREELYRQALVRAANSETPGPYDAELISFWRDLYYMSGTEMIWNPNTINNPALLNYWLDFLDSSQLKQFSVNEIGRRTKVVNNDKIKAIANKIPDDIIFVDGETEGLVNIIKKYNTMGQEFSIVPKDYINYFGISSTGASAYDTARELLYQHLVYNNSISITCTPKYFLEPNTLIYIKDADAAIDGSFVITQFTLPLTYNGMMTISAAEALTRE